MKRGFKFFIVIFAGIFYFQQILATNYYSFSIKVNNYTTYPIIVTYGSSEAFNTLPFEKLPAPYWSFISPKDKSVGKKYPTEHLSIKLPTNLTPVTLCSGTFDYKLLLAPLLDQTNFSVNSHTLKPNESIRCTVKNPVFVEKEMIFLTEIDITYIKDNKPYTCIIK